MRCVANLPRVRYSAAYPTGRERIVKGLLYHGVHSVNGVPIVLHSCLNRKGT